MQSVKWLITTGLFVRGEGICGKSKIMHSRFLLERCMQYLPCIASEFMQKLQKTAFSIEAWGEGDAVSKGERRGQKDPSDHS